MTKTEIDLVNALLETIAKLVEASAKDPKDAARIVRDCKVKE